MTDLFLVCSCCGQKACHDARKQNLLYTDRNAVKAKLQSSLSSYGRTMICHTPFLVGAGQLPKPKIAAAAMILANAWGGPLIQACCSENPRKFLDGLPDEKSLIQLEGDAAMTHSDGGSWLEALGAWRKPIILMAMPSQSGVLPGASAAYVALCEKLSVPLIGIVQIGAPWNQNLRKIDGLPWCGWIDEEDTSDLKSVLDSPLTISSNVLEIVFRLRTRMFSLDL